MPHGLQRRDDLALYSNPVRGSGSKGFQGVVGSMLEKG